MAFCQLSESIAHSPSGSHSVNKLLTDDLSIANSFAEFFELVYVKDDQPLREYYFN